MSWKVICSCCSLPFQVARDDFGRIVRCPRTGRAIRVPETPSGSTRDRKAPPGTVAQPPRVTSTTEAPPAPSRRKKRSARKRTRKALLGPAARAVLVIGVVVLFVGGFAAKRLGKPASKQEGQEVAAAATPLPTDSLPQPEEAIPAPTTPVAPKVVVIAPPPKLAQVAVAPSPRLVVRAATEPAAQVAVEPPPPAVRGFIVHSLPKRIDARPGDRVEQELLGMRELALDTPGSTRFANDLLSLARTRKTRGLQEPVIMLACRNRPELAGLPFRLGPDAVLPRDRATAMNALSKELRDVIQKNSDPDTFRPDPDKLYSALGADRPAKRDQKVWANAEAIPCIEQMLQAEGKTVRRMSCEMLRNLPGRASTETLARWAVFDTDPDNRAAAVAALRDRNPAEVTGLLVSHLRYPWARAVEHACEALIALDCTDAIPALAAAYQQPDPDAPFEVATPGLQWQTFRREVVRVNHLRNCVLCHVPSFETTDLVRGAIPDLNSPPPPPTTPAYYNSSSSFVAAEVTYLRQDFSVVQPVANPGKWPTHQRYDYLVAVRRTTSPVADGPSVASPYRAAIWSALRELSGRDPDQNPEWLRAQQRRAGLVDSGRTAEVARMLSMTANPNALVSIKQLDSTHPLLRQSDGELGQTVRQLQTAHGAPAIRLALVAYLDPLTRDLDPSIAAKAARLLAVVNGKLPDVDLPAKLREVSWGTD